MLLWDLWLGVHAVQAQREAFATYGSESGLSNLNVDVMVEDPAGTVWLGTQSGVFRANGVRFERQPDFDKAGLGFVMAMHFDHAGRLWVVSNRGFGYQDSSGVHALSGISFDSTNDGNVSLASTSNVRDEVLLAKDGKLFQITTADQGRTWSVRAALSPAILDAHPELSDITTVQVDADAHVWAGCGKRLCEFNPQLNAVRIWSERQGVPADQWRTLLTTRTGAVWARGNHDIVRLEPGSDRFQAVEPLPAGLYLNIQTPGMVEDPQGRVLVNLSKGIAREEAGHWRIINSSRGLPRDEEDALFFDHTGLLWLAPSGHGVAYWLGYDNWEAWTPNEGMSSETVWGIARRDHGPVWLATERGLDRLDVATGDVTIEPSRLDYRRTRTPVVDARGHVWTGDALGRLMELDPKTGRLRTTSGFIRITHLLIDRRERLWITSRQGLDYLDAASDWKVLHHVAAASIGTAAQAVEGRDGTLWFSTSDGLYRLEGERLQKIALPGVAVHDTNFVMAAAPDGTLWIETRADPSLLHLKIVGDTAVAIGEATPALIGSDNITFLEYDQRGWLWVGSDAGVSVYSGSRWVQCTTEDGLLWDDTDSFAFLADADGSVWIGTSGGLAHLRHPEVLFSGKVPEVRIGEARLGEVSLPVLGADANGGTYDLRHPALTVSLLSSDYSRPTAVVFRYHLGGLENEWEETTGSQLRFPALPPGGYTLTVEAFDRRLHLSSEQRRLSFKLLAPWWERLWFRTLERLGLVVILLLVWRASLRIMVARQQELEAQVRERTRELEAEKAELLVARAELIDMTRRDGLTGLMNRSAIFEKMAEECKIALETGDPLAVVMADLDRFKQVNDTYGHVVGDTVIRQCANRVRVTIRPGDSVGRYGGEELLILMPGLHPASAAARMEELRAAIASEPICHGDITLWMTCSFGVAWAQQVPIELEVLVGEADAALYRAKQKGRNRFELAGQTLGTGERPEECVPS
jgi:diguanylate cyclase (GGDEF)-like protein